jgi:GNAT superfamily N-acetyltransferase
VWIKFGQHDKDTGLPIAELILGGLRKPYRGKGLFPSCMDYIIDYVSNRGVKILGLNVESYNVKAKRLYEKVGFKTVTSWVCYQGYIGEMIEYLEKWHNSVSQGRESANG